MVPSIARSCSPEWAAPLRTNNTTDFKYDVDECAQKLPKSDPKRLQLMRAAHQLIDKASAPTKRYETEFNAILTRRVL